MFQSIVTQNNDHDDRRTVVYESGLTVKTRGLLPESA